MAACVLAVMQTTSVAASAIQHAPPQNAAAEAEATARDDLAVLSRFLDTDRSYSPPARAEAEAELARLEADVERLDRTQMALGAARIAALADNGHTVVVNGVGGPAVKRIPWRLMMLDGALVVADADETALIGAEVVSVGGASTQAIRLAARRYRGGVDSWRDLIMPELAEAPDVLAAMGLIVPGDTVEVRVRDLTGAEVRRTLKAVDAPPAGFFRGNPLRTTAERATTAGGAPQPLWLSHPRQGFVTADLPELDAVYVALRQTNDDGQIGIRDWLATTATQIDVRRPHNVILDMRLNGGGDLNTARDFMKALPGRLPADGKVFVLTSPMTFSAAISSIGYLKEAGGDRVVIVGEPIGDRLEFWAEGQPVQLPWSGVMVLSATERHNYMTGCPEEDCHGPIRRNPIHVGSLQPDIAAPMTAEAWVAGRDPALEAVTRYLGR